MPHQASLPSASSTRSRHVFIRRHLAARDFFDLQGFKPFIGNALQMRKGPLGQIRPHPCWALSMPAFFISVAADLTAASAPDTLGT